MSVGTGLRLGVFVFALLSCALAERALPRRTAIAPAAPRWRVNLILMLLGALAVRLLLPFAAMEAASRAEDAHLGLLNFINLSIPLKAALTVVLLDLLIYWQHRAFHVIPALWRLHAVHHTDLDLDASSAVRFHPVEILISMLIKMAAVVLLGASVPGVALFEIILSAAALFHHSNIALPLPLDAALRLLSVTPDMHRIHHSPNRLETDSNFSFNLTCWDRLFGTYRDQPIEPHATMALGLAETREPKALSLGFLLAYPWRKPS